MHPGVVTNAPIHADIKLEESSRGGPAVCKWTVSGW